MAPCCCCVNGNRRPVIFRNELRLRRAVLLVALLHFNEDFLEFLKSTSALVGFLDLDLWLLIYTREDLTNDSGSRTALRD